MYDMQDIRGRVLFTDYDGVFHPVSDLKWFEMRLPTEECIRRGRLFRWTYILAELLEPHVDVQLVVHSSWRHLHPENKLMDLLGPLQGRFAGVIPREYDRAEGILDYAKTHNLVDYRILDDHPECFPSGLPELIVCDSEEGVFDQGVRAQLLDWLERPSRVPLNGYF